MTELPLIAVIIFGIICATITYYIGRADARVIRDQRCLALEIENARLGEMLMRCLRN